MLLKTDENTQENSIFSALIPCPETVHASFTNVYGILRARRTSSVKRAQWTALHRHSIGWSPPYPSRSLSSSIFNYKRKLVWPGSVPRKELSCKLFKWRYHLRHIHQQQLHPIRCVISTVAYVRLIITNSRGFDVIFDCPPSLWPSLPVKRLDEHIAFIQHLNAKILLIFPPISP